MVDTRGLDFEESEGQPILYSHLMLRYSLNFFFVGSVVELKSFARDFFNIPNCHDGWTNFREIDIEPDEADP